MYKKTESNRIAERDFTNFPPLSTNKYSMYFHWPSEPGVTDIYDELDETINRLKNYGVTKALIRQHWKPGEPTADWTHTCKHTLIYLVTGKHKPREDFLPPAQCLSPIDALHEMSGLCFTRIYTLENLYRFGVRGEHLRALHGAENKPSLYHCFAFEELVAEQDLPILEAIEQVNQMTKDEAEHFAFPRRLVI